MKYNWGIVGTGWIAHEMGQALKNVNGTIYGVCSGKIANAQKFADEFNVERVYTDTKAMFADENIDIVYIATPHNLHYEIMKEALLQGKHVFCEKAITVNEKQLEECYTIAKEKISLSATVRPFCICRCIKIKKNRSRRCIGKSQNGAGQFRQLQRI